MKNYLGWLTALLSCTLAAQAQVKVNLVMDQNQFLMAEAVLVGVQVINQSGQPLKFGQDQGWLRFIVETSAGRPVSELSTVPVTGEFTVESSQIATRTVNLTPYYALNVLGRYRVTAVVTIKAWDQNLVSPTKEFDIVKGSRLWEQEFGVPRPEITNAPPEVRKYILLLANYLQQFRLYVKVSDPAELHALQVYAISSMVSFGHPDAKLDRACNLHVLCQSGARAFTYCVVNPDGRVILRQTHNISTTRPMLKTDGEGHIRLLGGVRIFGSEDIPDSDQAKGTNITKSIYEITTNKVDTNMVTTNGLMQTTPSKSEKTKKSSTNR